MQAKEKALIRKLKVSTAASKKAWRTRKQMLRLRPLMARIPEDLRKRLVIAAAWNGRSINAEINHRLTQSFPDLVKYWNVPVVQIKSDHTQLLKRS